MPGDKLVELARFNCIVPSPLPVFTGTVQVVPPLLVVGDPTVAPLTPEAVIEKLLAV
jgi:hypothetical protein